MGKRRIIKKVWGSKKDNSKMDKLEKNLKIYYHRESLKRDVYGRVKGNKLPE